MASKKRPDVIFEAKKLALALNRSVSTIRRALRELVNAGLLIFKSWVCKKLKVFTLLWKNEPKKKEAQNSASSLGASARENDLRQEPANSATKDQKPSPKKPKRSPFFRNEKGILCLKADELDQVREVAYKLVDIGFSKEAAIEAMNQQTLVVLQQAINDLTQLELRGEIIDDKVAWFWNRVL